MAELREAVENLRLDLRAGQEKSRAQSRKLEQQVAVSWYSVDVGLEHLVVSRGPPYQMFLRLAARIDVHVALHAFIFIFHPPQKRRDWPVI